MWDRGYAIFCGADCHYKIKMSTFSNNLIITKIAEFWKMLIPQNFKKIFVRIAQKGVFFLESH